MIEKTVRPRRILPQGGTPMPISFVSRVFHHGEPPSGQGNDSHVPVTLFSGDWRNPDGQTWRLFKMGGTFLRLTDVDGRLRDHIVRWATDEGLCTVTTRYRARRRVRGGAGEEVFEGADRDEALMKSGLVLKDGEWHDGRTDDVLSETQAFSRTKRVHVVEGTALLAERTDGREIAVGLTLEQRLALVWAEIADEYDGCIGAYEDGHIETGSAVLFPSKLSGWKAHRPGQLFGHRPEKVFIDREGVIHLRADGLGPRHTEVAVEHVETQRLLYDIHDLKERSDGFLVGKGIDPDLIEAGDWHWSDLIKAGYQIRGTVREPTPGGPAEPPAAGMGGTPDHDAFSRQMSFVLDAMDHLSHGEIMELKGLDPFFRKRVHEIVAELYARGRKPEEAASAIRREIEASAEWGIEDPSADGGRMRP